MVEDQKIDREISPPSSGQEQIHPDVLDRRINQSSDFTKETPVERAAPATTPTDPFAGFGSFG